MIIIYGFLMEIPRGSIWIKDSDSNKLQVKLFGVRKGWIMAVMLCATQIVINVALSRQFDVPIVYSSCKYANDVLPDPVSYNVTFIRTPVFTNSYYIFSLSTYTAVPMKGSYSTLNGYYRSLLFVPPRFDGMSISDYYEAFFSTSDNATVPNGYKKIIYNVYCKNESFACEYYMGSEYVTSLNPSKPVTVYSDKYINVQNFYYSPSLYGFITNTSAGIFHTLTNIYGNPTIIAKESLQNALVYIRFYDNGSPIYGGNDATISRECSESIVISKDSLDALKRDIGKLNSDVSSYNDGIVDVNREISKAERDANDAEIKNRLELDKVDASAKDATNNVVTAASVWCAMWGGSNCVNIHIYKPDFYSAIPNIDMILPITASVAIPGTRTVNLCDTYKTIKSTVVQPVNVVSYNTPEYRKMVTDTTATLNAKFEANIRLANIIAGTLLALRILVSGVVTFKTYPIGIWVRMSLGTISQFSIFIVVLVAMYVTVDNMTLYINRMFVPVYNYAVSGSCKRNYPSEDTYRFALSRICMDIVNASTILLNSVDYQNLGCGNSTECSSAAFHTTVNCSNVHTSMVNNDVSSSGVVSVYTSGLVYNVLRSAAGSCILILSFDIGFPLISYMAVDTLTPTSLQIIIYMIKWYMGILVYVLLIFVAIFSALGRSINSVGAVLALIFIGGTVFSVLILVLKYYSIKRLLLGVLNEVDMNNKFRIEMQGTESSKVDDLSFEEVLPVKDV